MSSTFQAATHADDLGESLNAMRAFRAGRIREFRTEQRMVRRDGEIVWVDLSVSPMWEPGEKPTWHIAVMEDISARKRAEAQIKRLYEELEQRVQERTAELAATVRELES
jgi:PAS domain S-box-containing protein